MGILKNKRVILMVLLILSIVAGVEAVGSKNKIKVQRQMMHVTDQASRGSNITLDVEFKNYQDEDPEFWEFEVFINTHSEDLSRYSKLGNFLDVKVDEVPVQPEIIFERRGAGHHITNILRIKNEYEGRKLLDKGTKDIKLIFKNIGDVKERVHSYKF